jgi:protease I
MANLSNFRVAVIATDGFEESELTEPIQALKEAGARVEILSDKKDFIQGVRHFNKGVRVSVDRLLHESDPKNYDGLLLPGGALNADKLRMNALVQSFIKEFQSAQKPIATICHAAWLLISSGVVRGRTLTSYHTIQEDIRNAGGNWLDKEAVVDKNWVTSRKSADIPAFNREMIALFSRGVPRVIQVKESA